VVTADDRSTILKKNHKLELGSAKLKATSFDKDQVTMTDDRYQWSSLPSQYLSEANVNAVQMLLRQWMVRPRMVASRLVLGPVV
jgi:hypothetical protein